jgi:putative ABC transport system ATP-binding protein
VVITHNTVVAGMADRVVNISDGIISGITRNPHRQAAKELTW